MIEAVVVQYSDFNTFDPDGILKGKVRAMAKRQSTKEISEELAERADRPEGVSAGEYRKLFIKGLAALLREVDSISYRVREYSRIADANEGRRVRDIGYSGDRSGKL